MNLMCKCLPAVAAALSLPCAALAHPGHHGPEDGGGLLHALTHWDHLVVVVLVGAVVVAATNAAGAVIVRLRRRNAVSSVVRRYRDRR